jgi:hypothetical protein
LSQNPYSPPGAPVKDHGPDRAIPDKPQQVIYAVWLLWLAIPAGIPGSVFEYQNSPGDEQGPAFIAFYVLAYLVGMALNVFISRGHNWARIVTLVFFVLFVTLFYEYVSYPFLPLAGNVAVLVLDGIALYLLFTHPGKLWFRRAS